MTPERPRISAWMDEASSGDDEAFAALAEAVQDGLYRFALAQGLPGADAADAVQETFLRAYRARSSWRNGSDAASWLYGIAMNVVREARRKARRELGLDLDLDNISDPHGPDRRDELDAELDPAELAGALAGLPERQREAVACRFLLEMSVKDTAEAMGCAEGTVKAAVFSGLENLRKVLKDRR